MNRLREILLHMCVICSLICISAKVLDWYNPYMDFSGHIWGIQMALCLAVFVLAAFQTPVRQQKIPGKRNVKRNKTNKTA